MPGLLLYQDVLVLLLVWCVGGVCLQWAIQDGAPVAPGPGAIQIGVSIESGAEIISKEGSKLGARQDFAKRVGMDLFRYVHAWIMVVHGPWLWMHLMIGVGWQVGWMNDQSCCA